MPLITPVDAPQARPPVSSLIRASATQEDTEHQKWEMGFGYMPEARGAGQFAKSQTTAHRGTDLYKGELADPHYLIQCVPIILTAEEANVSVFGMGPQEYQGRAERRLGAMQSKILEFELWTGEVAEADGLDPAEGFQWFANDQAVDLTPTGGAVTPRMALAILEEALGNVGVGAGFIHCTRRMAMLLPDRWSEGLLYSQLDSVLVLGSGYPGTAPDGTEPAAGEEWMYATDPVHVRLGPIEITPSPERLAEVIDKSTNTVSYVAERYGAATWDGDCHFAIRTQLA